MKHASASIKLRRGWEIDFWYTLLIFGFLCLNFKVKKMGFGVFVYLHCLLIGEYG